MINGVVPAYSACIEAFSEENDEVIVQTPIYPPLFKCVTANNRKVVVNESKKDENGYYTMDLEDLEKKRRLFFSFVNFRLKVYFDFLNRLNSQPCAF